MEPYAKFNELSREAILELSMAYREFDRTLLGILNLPKQTLRWAMPVIREVMRNNLTPTLHDAFIQHLVYGVCFELHDFLSLKEFYEYIYSILQDNMEEVENMQCVIQLERFSIARVCSPLEGILFKCGVSESEFPEENEVA